MLTTQTNFLSDVKGLDKEEFESRLKKTRTGNHFLYEGSPTTRGYGRVYTDGKQVYAARVAYALAHGKTLEEIEHLRIIIICAVNACCNPDHLVAKYKK